MTGDGRATRTAPDPYLSMSLIRCGGRPVNLTAK
jgi:hypothetical protein